MFTKQSYYHFKHELGELYTITDALIKEYLTTDSVYRKNVALGDFLELTKEITMNNCKRFIRYNNAVELSLEDAYSIAIGQALMEALNRYDLSRGVYFLRYWMLFIDSCLCNQFKKEVSQTSKFYRTFEYGDAPIGESGTTFFSQTASEVDVAERVASKVSLKTLIDDFIAETPFGEVIWCETIKTQHIKTQKILEIFGAEENGVAERKRYQRIKKKFVDYLHKNNVDVSLFL